MVASVAGLPQGSILQGSTPSPIRLSFMSEAVAIGATECRASNGCGAWPEVK